jgi:hypothetical protein
VPLVQELAWVVQHLIHGQVKRVPLVLLVQLVQQGLEQLQVAQHLIHGLVLQDLLVIQAQLVLLVPELLQEQQVHQIQEQQEIQDLPLQQQIIHQPKYTLTRRLP